MTYVRTIQDSGDHQQPSGVVVSGSSYEKRELTPDKLAVLLKTPGDDDTAIRCRDKGFHGFMERAGKSERIWQYLTDHLVRHFDTYGHENVLKKFFKLCPFEEMKDRVREAGGRVRRKASQHDALAELRLFSGNNGRNKLCHTLIGRSVETDMFEKEWQGVVNSILSVENPFVSLSREVVKRLWSECPHEDVKMFFAGAFLQDASLYYVSLSEWEPRDIKRFHVLLDIFGEKSGKIVLFLKAVESMTRLPSSIRKRVEPPEDDSFSSDSTPGFLRKKSGPTKSRKEIDADRAERSEWDRQLRQRMKGGGGGSTSSSGPSSKKGKKGKKNKKGKKDEKDNKKK